MNMIDAVKSVLSQYFGFSGRARRSEFWFWVLATILVRIVFLFIESLLGISYEGAGPISTIFNLLIFIPGLAVSFRRLHDTGRSGWWIGGFYLALIAYFIIIFTMAFSAVGLRSGGDTTALASMGVVIIVALLAILILAIVLLIFFCQDSKTGPNKYGSNPKNLGNYDIFE